MSDILNDGRSLTVTITSRSGALGELMALIGGALMPLAFSPFDIWPLAILLLALLLWLCEGVTPSRAGWRGALFGLGMFSTGISWVYVSLHDYGNAPAAFAVLTTLLLILVMALYPWLAAYLLTRWAPRPGALKWLLVAPALWTVLEWIRSWLFTGFPWLSLGYSQVDSPLGGLAPYLGVFGVSWAVLLSAGLLLLLIHANWRTRLLWTTVAIVFWAGAWSLGQINWGQAEGQPLRVSLIQGNISQDRKFRPEELERTWALYAGLSLEDAEGSDLIIWPETAIPILYQSAQTFLEPLEARARVSGVDYLIGIPSGTWDSGIFHNSVVSLGRSHGLYHKHRLLPFGEYLPLRFLLNFFHSWVDIPMSDFTPGDGDQPLLQAAGYPVGVSICFEAAFGSEIRLSLPQARFLVNVSNDAWFGNSLAPHQHLQIARMRALEARRYLARVTNTGISALIDDRGQIIAQSEQFSVQVLQGSMQAMRGATPYVVIGDTGMLVMVSLLLVLGLALERSVVHPNPFLTP